MINLFCFMGWIISCSLLAFSAEKDLRRGNKRLSLGKMIVGIIVLGAIFMSIMIKAGVN